MPATRSVQIQAAFWEQLTSSILYSVIKMVSRTFTEIAEVCYSPRFPKDGSFCLGVVWTYRLCLTRLKWAAPLQDIG
jgi:hypothetical protein